MEDDIAETEFDNLELDNYRAQKRTIERHRMPIQEEIAISFCDSLHLSVALRKKYGEEKAIDLLSEQLAIMLKKTGDDKFLISMAAKFAEKIGAG